MKPMDLHLSHKDLRMLQGMHIVPGPLDTSAPLPWKGSREESIRLKNMLHDVIRQLDFALAAKRDAQKSARFWRYAFGFAAGTLAWIVYLLTARVG
jgi:hypothetical protein